MAFFKTSHSGALFCTPSLPVLVAVPQRVLKRHYYIRTLPADVAIDSLDLDLVLWSSVCYGGKSSLLNCFFIYVFG